jgi:hypothetical protein
MGLKGGCGAKEGVSMMMCYAFLSERLEGLTARAMISGCVLSIWYSADR